MGRLLELREFCESLPKSEFPEIDKLRLSIDEWNVVKEIESTLVHFAIRTKKMQTVRISLSDFFGGWAKIKFELNKLDSDLSKKLLAEMKKREPVLFNNSVLNAAVFLDPRFQQYMPNHHKEAAIKFLSKLYDRINSFKSSECEPLQSLSESTNEFNGFLSSIYGESNTNVTNENINEQTTTANIDTMLREFIGTTDSLDNLTIFDYWQQKMHTKPEMYELASIVHSVPPTQTTVERAFSAMALILSPLRTNLSDKNLENVLLLRLNRDLFQDICPLDKF